MLSTVMPRDPRASEAQTAGQLPPPHGGRGLQCCQVPPEEAAELPARAASLPRIEVSSRAEGDILMLGNGAFSPLRGFMGREDWQSVCRDMTLADGTFWPVPITLDVAEEVAAALRPGQEAALWREGRCLAIMQVEEVWPLTADDRRRECEQVFRGRGPASDRFWETAPDDHPGVRMVLAQQPYNVAGTLRVLAHSRMAEQFPDLILDPLPLREALHARGWRDVAALQLRNPMHRSHEYLAKIALEVCDGVVIHSLVGALKPGDIPAAVRLRCIDTLVRRYFVPQHVIQAGYPLDMRYAGPREALLHALFRQNYGISRLIVGRDHAGVGDYYGLFEAQEIFRHIPQPSDPAKRLHTQALPLDWTFYCTACDGMASLRTCPHGPEERVILSGTRLRKLLSEGQPVPDHFGRPEVLEILREYYAGLSEADRPVIRLQQASTQPDALQAQERRRG